MHRLHLTHFGPVSALPILHNRMECAWLVRTAVEKVRPDCIAIELPATIETPFLRGIRRLPQISLLSYETPDRFGRDQTTYLIIEPADPLVEASRLAMEQGIQLSLVDLDLNRYPDHPEQLPDSYAVTRIGLQAFYEEYNRAAQSHIACLEDQRREQGMVWQLQQLADRFQRILFICGMAHLQRIQQQFSSPQPPPLSRRSRDNMRLTNLHPESCREILGEFPFISSVYELRRTPLPPLPTEEIGSMRRRFSAFELIQGGKKPPTSEAELMREAMLRAAHGLGPADEFPDRQRIHLGLFKEAVRHYRQETGDAVHFWQKKAFFRFARNYAAVNGRLLPDLYQLLAASRGCIDDNFAYAFCRLATAYPWQKEESELPTQFVSPEEIWGSSLTIRFRPRQKRQAKGLSPLQFLRRKKEKHPGEWLEGFDNPSICSHPPEDLAIEAYGTFLKKKGAKQLSEEQYRIEPMTSSLLDGIDLRETIRNLHERKIYVREQQRVTGGVGCVVVIFTEDRKDAFPYLMTWLGEHEQESDMAFYATPPAENVVGPGICRCEYGGFLLAYPPRRMIDVWTDPDYAFARGKHERLLLAALDYSLEKHIVYAAPRPPRSMYRQLAARLGKKIVYLPLGSLSPVKLKELRVLHILYGHDKREIAKDYVW